MDPKVHVPPQFPGAVSDASSVVHDDLGSRWLGPWWTPLAAVWAVVLACRHALYDWGFLPSHRGALPTLVLGNVELGGTGKTPHVMDVARRLESVLGKDTVGILSRGYGRTSSGFLWVNETPNWEDVGDEPWLMQSALPSAQVAVCENRVAGVRRMAEDRPKLKVVVLDDGLQHRALRPDVTLGLVARPLPRGAGWASLVPAGPYRDLPSRLQRCDHLVDTSGQNPSCAWSSRTETSPPVKWSLSNVSEDASQVLDEPALLITGIARPARVAESAKHHASIAGHAFYPDHHAFTAKDIVRWRTWMTEAGTQSLLTTEKDAVRLRAHRDLLAGIHVWVLPLQVVWHSGATCQAFLESWTQTLPSQSKPLT